MEMNQWEDVVQTVLAPGASSILAIHANGAPWCCEHSQPARIHSESSFLPVRVGFIFASYSLLAAAFIWTRYPSVHPFMQQRLRSPYCGWGTLPDAGNTVTRESHMVPTLPELTV